MTNEKQLTPRSLQLIDIICIDTHVLHFLISNKQTSKQIKQQQQQNKQREPPPHHKKQLELELE